MKPTPLQDPTINVKQRLAALWTSLMFCYVYGDYFGLYEPGKLRSMLEGRMVPLGPVTQPMLLATAAMMAIPALMVFLSLVFKPRLNRALNLVLGLAYTAIMLLSMPGAWWFYLFLGGIEVLLSLAIVWTAWRWPRSIE